MTDERRICKHCDFGNYEELDDIVYCRADCYAEKEPNDTCDEWIDGH